MARNQQCLLSPSPALCQVPGGAGDQDRAFAEPLSQWSLIFLATGFSFMKTIFPWTRGLGDGFRIITFIVCFISNPSAIVDLTGGTSPSLHWGRWTFHKSLKTWWEYYSALKRRRFCYLGLACLPMALATWAASLHGICQATS